MSYYLRNNMNGLCCDWITIHIFYYRDIKTGSFVPQGTVLMLLPFIVVRRLI